MGMGRLIISTQITADGVIDQVEKWLTIDWDSGSRGRLARPADRRRGAPARSPDLRGPVRDLAAAHRRRRLRRAHELDPKHVASRSALGPLEWNSHALPGDFAEGVRALKEQLSGNLFAPGCGELASSLVEAGVADEVLLWVHPLVLGEDGARPFHGRGRIELELAGSTAFDNGIVCQTYRPL